ncbi:MAG: hypothetical protein V3U84_12105 [Thiotrichaceae bacterium]
MNQQLMVRLVPRHTLQMRFFLILAQPLQARHVLEINTLGEAKKAERSTVILLM